MIFNIPNCQQTEFSNQFASQRIEKARKILGNKVVTKILSFALYLMGAKRSEIASQLGLSENSLRTTLRSLFNDGLPALEDRRSSFSAFLPKPTPNTKPTKVILKEDKSHIVINFAQDASPITIPLHNQIQSRTFLLSLVNAGVVETKVAADILKLSVNHTRNLAANLHDGDVAAILDKRQGQQHSFVLTTEVKSQIILQSAANALSCKSTSSQSIVRALSERCKLNLSDRTVRDCLSKLGLNTIARSLPKLVDSIKKGSTQK